MCYVMEMHYFPIHSAYTLGFAAIFLSDILLYNSYVELAKLTTENGKALVMRLARDLFSPAVRLSVVSVCHRSTRVSQYA